MAATACCRGSHRALALLIDSDLAEFPSRAAGKFDAVPRTPDSPARAEEPAGADVLVRLGGGQPCPGESEWRELLAGRPAEPHRDDSFRMPAEVFVALVPAVAAWQLPAVLGYGGWEGFPTAAAHSAILRHWRDAYGAELVCMTTTSVELAVARPPRTRPDALAFAWEYAGYCPDSVDTIYQADDLAALAAGLIDAEVVHAWWD
ncbi:DUF4253 domain-containing protein [Amycolatopsis sp. DG1A-15b]|uniref:DUF4253 domain-containing protein n=1 Tax=Amycolatopsis sp. DG1A-15b TaxID=3052846 RepID=UPI00255B848A|nr:DUF4253 domain-containing protein [Amycolatopsis sp. DG1A-15b]WIX92354.1 DUF4253 domain-containing protein [Amycolatopsis sp. DG1A-15b]